MASNQRIIFQDDICLQSAGQSTVIPVLLHLQWRLTAVVHGSNSILQIVIVEGLIIGLLSWFFGLFLALPFISISLSRNL
ncbi:MAG: hypothetical protein MUE99_01315, partial [Chitinophagaceae bacterium]|nr:hypothetical protein [Chitinophagaceae bacterium]